MLSWLAENGATLLISAGLVALVTAIVVHLVRCKKKGVSSCGCRCSDCSLHGGCHH